MKIYNFKQTQIIPSDIDTVWNFFSSPLNLNKITPPNMNFKIVDMGGSEMQKGQRIKYKVSPFPFLRVTWITGIADVDAKRFFADTQIKGPFTMWYHQHNFAPVTGGIEMTDHVSYSIPLGLIGIFANDLFVQHRVCKIFEYRRQQIELLFPKPI